MVVSRIDDDPMVCGKDNAVPVPPTSSMNPIDTNPVYSIVPEIRLNAFVTASTGNLYTVTCGLTGRLLVAVLLFLCIPDDELCSCNVIDDDDEGEESFGRVVLAGVSADFALVVVLATSRSSSSSVLLVVLFRMIVVVPKNRRRA